MRSRSRVHMLSVAAARLEQDYANPKLVADLRDAAKHAASKKAAGEDYDEQEQKRIERQRTLFVMLPSTNAADRLKEAMLQRAYDLMWDGRATECDAIVEFLPSADVYKMFEAWERDQAPGPHERSRFYEPKGLT